MSEAKYIWRGQPQWAVGYIPDFLRKSCTLQTRTVSETIGFDELLLISGSFGTSNINIEGRAGTGGGCDTCGDGRDDGYLEVYISDITRWPHDET